MQSRGHRLHLRLEGNAQEFRGSSDVTVRNAADSLLRSSSSSGSVPAARRVCAGEDGGAPGGRRRPLSARATTMSNRAVAAEARRGGTGYRVQGGATTKRPGSAAASSTASFAHTRDERLRAALIAETTRAGELEARHQWVGERAAVVEQIQRGARAAARLDGAKLTAQDWHALVKASGGPGFRRTNQP